MLISRRTAITGIVAMLVATTALVAVALRAQRLPEPEGQPRAPGLRGNALPESLAGALAPAFELPAARGGMIDTDALRGRPYAVTFLYTRCPDVCPLIGQQVRRALEIMGDDAASVTVVAVSVDPRGDTPEGVRAWLRRQRLPATFRYAIGRERQLKPVWDAYFAAPQVPGRPETSLHTASVWLIDARGRLRTKYSAGAPFSPRDLAHDLSALADEA